MYKHCALLMVGLGLVACGGEGPQSSPKEAPFAGAQRSPAATPSVSDPASPATASGTVRGPASPTPSNVMRGFASLVSTPATISLGSIPLQTRGANGDTSGALASVAATVTNTSSTWSSDALTVSLAGSPEIVKGNASCAGQLLPASGACQDSYMLDCTGAATEGAKSAVVTVTDPSGGSSTTFAVSGTCDPAVAGVAQIGFTPTSADFGTVAQNANSAVQQFTLKNTGAGATQPLPVPVISGSSEFRIDSVQCTAASLASLGSCGVSVYLNCGATTAGTKTGSVTYTAPNGGSVATATFTGACVAAVAGASCSFNSDCASGICDSITSTCK